MDSEFSIRLRSATSLPYISSQDLPLNLPLLATPIANLADSGCCIPVRGCPFSFHRVVLLSIDDLNFN